MANGSGAQGRGHRGGLGWVTRASKQWWVLSNAKEGGEESGKQSSHVGHDQLALGGTLDQTNRSQTGSENLVSVQAAPSQQWSEWEVLAAGGLAVVPCPWERA